MNLDPIKRAVQAKLGVTVDGNDGEATWKAIFRAVAGQPWQQPAPEPLPPVGIEGFPNEAITLILDEEGLDQPGRWPGGGSGITLGYGCDIGADPNSLAFWHGFLPDEQIARLASAKNVTGRAAAQIASRFADIKVSRADAAEVFMQTSLPREIKLTLRTFPGINKLPPAVLGAITSIVYNRGSDLTGERRREMAAIANLIAAGGDNTTLLPKIAAQIRAMKRLWQSQGLDGLLKRRDREAAMVEAAA